MVSIVEVGPRDGLQNESTPIDTPTKVELITRLVDAGVRRVEATSFAHPKRVPQMADAEDVMAAVPRRDDVSYIGLVLNQRGLQRAVDAGVDEVNAVVCVTDTFSQRNQGMSVDEALEAWAQIAEGARRAGLGASLTLSAAFGCPFEGEIDVQRVLDVARRGAEAGPDEVALGDTIGVAVPSQVRTTFEALGEALPGVPLRMHAHNTRNTGYASAVAALEAGADRLDASVGGIGGCPFAPNATGNIATEDLTYLLRREGEDPGLDLDALSETAVWIGERLGRTVPGLLSRAGDFPA